MNSTRFEHSLGVMHLASLAASWLDLSDVDTSALKAACLLHDVGHGPFSHTSDQVLSRRGFPHEDNSCKIIRDSEISDILSESGLDPEFVTGLIMGEGSLGNLVSSEIDLDKMDYLIRDSYYAGVAYGVIDVERVLYSLKLVKDDLVIDSRGLEAVESLLISRNMMYQTVYRHHAKRIAESMFVHALEKMMDDGLSIIELSLMDDISLMSLMRDQSGYVGDIIDRIDRRCLFKNFFSEKIISMTDTFRTELEEDIYSIEERIAKDFQVDKGYVLLDYPEIRLNEFHMKIEVDGRLEWIYDVSTLAKDLEKSEQEKLLFNIYVAPEQIEKMDDFNENEYIEYSQTKLDKFT